MRKLTCGAVAYTITVFLLHYLNIDRAVSVILPLCIAASVIAWFCLRGKLRTGALIAAVFVMIGVVRYETHYKATVVPFENYIGTECRISGELCEYPVVYEDSVKYTVRIASDLMPIGKAVIYDYTSSETDLRPGAEIRATVRLSSALLSSGEETNNYISKGIYVRGYVTDEITVGSDNMKLKYLPLYFGQWIRNCISQYLPARSAAFLHALMTGDKTELYADAKLNHVLTRAGLAHVVTVSGMHVSFVVSLAMLLFDRRKGWMASLLLMVLFAVMTGLSPSVVRAVFMQSLFLLAPVLRREADGLTSISFPLLVILLVNPFAVASVGLQLSFLAMTGIILVTPRAVDWFEQKNPFTNEYLLRVYRFVTVSLSSSLGATIFTAPVCAYYFGNISVLSPLTNLLVLWIVPYCFAGGFLLCVVSVVFTPAATLIAQALHIGVSFVYQIADSVGQISVASVYLPEAPMIAWFVSVYAVMGLMLLVRKNGLYRPFVPFVFAVLSLLFFAERTHNEYTNGMTVGAVDVGQGQCIAVLEGDTTILADCGGVYDSGDRTARWLYSHGRKQVDVLILSHFDEDHVNGVTDLMLRIPVKEIYYCGNNLTEEDLLLFAAIKDMSSECGTRLRLVNTVDECQWGGVYCRLTASEGDSSNDGLITFLQSGGYEILIMGDAGFDAEKQLLRNSWLREIDCLVIGHHGSASSTSEALLQRTSPEIAVVSCGYNSYGHPEQEVLDRLRAENVIIYRTDQLGSIEIKVR